MNLIKKKFILYSILTSIAAASLTGCGDNTHRINNTNIKVNWENEEVIGGTVPYDDIYGNIKVVILEQNGTIKPYLIVKEKGWDYHSVCRVVCTYVEYIDLRRGTPMVRYWWNDKNADTENNEPDDIGLGKHTTILEEREFYDYLYEYEDIVNDLDIMEIIKIYDEIEPKLIEYISKEYNYTKSISN